MKNIKTGLLLSFVMAVLIVLPVLAAQGVNTTNLPAGGVNGTTLAGYKTIDICSLQDATWRYSGEIAVWNEGVINTVGLNITDFIEYKAGTKWIKAYDMLITLNGVATPPFAEIPAGTTLLTATVYKYKFNGAPLPGTIRNNAKITILNHSNYFGTPFGPNPKATWAGEVKPCPVGLGCTYTQGYWKNHLNVWPSPYSPYAQFFLSGQTWHDVQDTSVNVSQGYYQLAHQYIAAVLNQANGAYVPSGVQVTLNLANNWLNSNDPSACTANASCGTQKDWAKVLDTYNNGKYPGGPGHCG